MDNNLKKEVVITLSQTETLEDLRALREAAVIKYGCNCLPFEIFDKAIELKTKKLS